MAKISESEIKTAVSALKKANAYDQKIALSSQSGLVKFLKRVGEHILAQKIADLISAAVDIIIQVIFGALRLA